MSLGLTFQGKEHMNEDTTKPWIDKVFRPALVAEIEELTQETKYFARFTITRFNKKMKQELMEKLKRLESLETMIIN